MSDTGTQDAAAAAAAQAAAAAANATKFLSADPGYAALDAETKGYLENRGLDKKSPFDAVLEAAKAHREAEKHLGAPAKELLRLPSDPNSADWAKVWQRLGAPADAKEYDFSGVKFADGSDVDEAFQDALRPVLLAKGISKAAAPDIAKAVVAFMDKADAADLAERTAQLQTEREALRVSWGANVEANMFVAKQGAAKLGVTPEQVDQLEKQIGYSKVMEMFRKAGEMSGEARYIANQSPGGTGAMTVEQAESQLADLQNDSAWNGKLLNGDREANRTFQALTTLIASAGRR